MRKVKYNSYIRDLSVCTDTTIEKIGLFHLWGSVVNRGGSYTVAIIEDEDDGSVLVLNPEDIVFIKE